MRTLNGEKGFVLLTALLIMIVLTLLGIAAMWNSGFEMHIAGNERLKKDSLFAADAGTETATPVLSYYIDESPATYAGLRSDIKGIIRNGNDNFLSEVMGYSDNDGDSDTTTNNPDVEMTVQDRQVKVDIDRLYKRYITGSQVDNMGSQPVPSIAVFYRASTLGQSAVETRTTVEAICRQFPNSQ